MWRFEHDKSRFEVNENVLHLLGQSYYTTDQMKKITFAKITKNNTKFYILDVNVRGRARKKW
jgi:uncharacterized protein YajQ (UPF0234 family)